MKKAIFYAYLLYFILILRKISSKPFLTIKVVEDNLFDKRADVLCTNFHVPGHK